MCGKFGLMEHIDGSPPRPADPAWVQAECCVNSWLFRSVADNVLDIAMEPDQTARHLWVSIQDLFQANKVPHAIFLSHQFHSMTQGDLPVSEYCHKMKHLADQLRDVGHAISEPHLVLNLLHGLSDRFTNTADDIANSRPLPSFTQARGMLCLKELRAENTAKVSKETALVAAANTSESCGGTGCRSSSSSAGNSGGCGGPGGTNRSSGGGGDNHRGNRNGGGKQQQAAVPAAPQPAGPWVCFNPWAGLEPHGAPGWCGQQAWGGQGAYQQAHTAFAPPYVSPPPPQAQAWDQAHLIAAMNQMNLQSAGPWVLDTGATSDMSPTDGPSDAARSAPAYFPHQQKREGERL
ncbi:hypothetical protein ACP70R_015558 [Stipagrostis hirtigluma subsp. patula]